MKAPCLWAEPPPSTCSQLIKHLRSPNITGCGLQGVCGIDGQSAPRQLVTSIPIRSAGVVLMANWAFSFCLYYPWKLNIWVCRIFLTHFIYIYLENLHKHSLEGNCLTGTETPPERADPRFSISAEFVLPPAGRRQHCTRGDPLSSGKILQICLQLFFISEGGGRSQNPGGVWAPASGAGEALPEGGAGAAGEKEGESSSRTSYAGFESCPAANI